MLKVFLLLVLIKWGSCANILYVSEIPSPSHHIFNRVLAFALAEKGHNVTMLATDVEKETHQNLHVVLMEGVYEAIDGALDFRKIVSMTTFEGIPTMYNWANAFCYDEFKSKGFNLVMDYPKDFKFDLIVFDITLGQCLYPIIDRFNKPPVVGITPFLIPPYLINAMGSHAYPSYYPHYSNQYTNNMSFFQRLHSFLLTYFEFVYRNVIYERQQLEIMKRYFGEGVRNMLEVERDVGLLLANTDPILDYPLPLPPNIIPVGGMHIKAAKPLPEDLKKIMENAKHGVIFFSLGSNIPFHVLGPEIRNEFLAAFSKLKETVIWKYEKEIDNLPSNVVIRKWLPQLDILGHPKCKLFLSHGGGLSTQEAIYHGVPIVGMPFFTDQHKNVHKFVSKGFGVKLHFENLNRDSIFKVVREVLDKPEYTKKIKEASKKYHDQPQTPLQRAVFWTEYVLRHQGAEDLSLPARDMYFFQTSYSDVVLFLLVSVLTVILTIYKCVQMTCCTSKKYKQKTN